MLQYQGLDRRVCAELLPEVAEAVGLFRGNYGAGQDPRLQIRLMDGRRELLRSDEMYDMITMEPPPPSAAGVVNLYSTDFYRLAAARLNVDGLLAQWLPLPTQTDQDTRSLVRSFLDVFPHVTLWTTELHEMMLVGSMSPIELDARKIASRFSQPTVSQSLHEVGIESPAALLATYVCDRTDLEIYAGGVAAVTDDHPRIEYSPWVLPDDFPKTLAALMKLQREPQLVHASAELVSAINDQRLTINEFYASGLAAYQKDTVQWERSFSKVLSRDPENPYYRWFAPKR
jgi:spermidine synthase